MVLITTLVITTSTREFGIISKLSRPKTGIPPYVGVWTVLEQGEHLARRQELVGFSRGGDRKSDEFQTATVAVRKPTNELARAIGLSERSAHNRISVARALQYAQDLTAHLQSQLDEQTARLDALTAWLALPLYKRIGKKPPK